MGEEDIDELASFDSFDGPLDDCLLPDGVERDELEALLGVGGCHELDRLDWHRRVEPDDDVASH